VSLPLSNTCFNSDGVETHEVQVIQQCGNGQGGTPEQKKLTAAYQTASSPVGSATNLPTGTYGSAGAAPMWQERQWLDEVELVAMVAAQAGLALLRHVLTSAFRSGC